MRRRNKGLFFVVWMLLYTPIFAAAPDLRASMIQRIAMFIEWNLSSKKNITIGAYRDSESYDRFKHLYRNQKIRGNAITVKEFTELFELDSLENGDILYIGAASSSQRLHILQKLAHKGVLLIGKTRDDARAGIAVVLLEEGDHYQILINQKALKSSNLRADYHLLKLSELVNGN